MSLDPQPVNPFGWLILLLLGLTLYLLGFSQASSVQTLPEPSLDRPVGPIESRGPVVGLPPNAELLGVDRFEIIAAKSNPPQVSIRVHGYWSDGCNFPSGVNVQRSVDQITVQIYREVQPNVMCTQMLQEVSTEISLSEILMEGSSFRSGTYTIDVNGVVQQAAF